MTEVKDSKLKTFFKQKRESYKAWKLNFNAETMVKIYKFCAWFLAISFFIWMPVAFTLFSTLAGNGAMPMWVYQSVFWITWILMLLFYVMFNFTSEFRRL